MALKRKMTRLAKASPKAIASAAACLRAGGLVAMPTETVYGLAADATSDKAVAAIYAAKERPAINPLIAHVLDVEAARGEAVFSSEAEKLCRAFWPGPLTLVLPVAPASRISLLARAGLDTVAVRSPSHEIARAHQVSPKQIALAWLLRRSPIMLPIPGTSSVEHLEENVAAASVRLTGEEYERLADAPELASVR